MEYLLAFVSIIAGLGIGASVVLYFWLKNAILEGRLWANKALVRDGQAKIFPSAMIDAGTSETPTPNQPQRVLSTFRKGVDRLRGKVDFERIAQPLPVEIEDKIKNKIKERMAN